MTDDISPQEKAITLSALASKLHKTLERKGTGKPKNRVTASRVKAALDLADFTIVAAAREMGINSDILPRVVNARQTVNQELAEQLAQLTNTNSAWLIGLDKPPIEGALRDQDFGVIKPDTPAQLILDLKTHVEPNTGNLTLAVNRGRVEIPAAAEMAL